MRKWASAISKCEIDALGKVQRCSGGSDFRPSASDARALSDEPRAHF